ncbi:MAG: response regulator [Myxococcales bacterium]|nr:response regulator [Myxococcales bacterium]
MAEKIDRPTILVADDDEEIRRIVRKLLEKNGYHVIEARDGEEALSLLIEETPQGVILDVMMPTLTGWEICKYARTHPAYEKTAILMLTGIGRTVNEMTSPLYGADAYLDKPFELVELKNTLSRILAERGAERGT